MEELHFSSEDDTKDGDVDVSESSSSGNDEGDAEKPVPKKRFPRNGLGRGRVDSRRDDRANDPRGGTGPKERHPRPRQSKRKRTEDTNVHKQPAGGGKGKKFTLKAGMSANRKPGDKQSSKRRVRRKDEKSALH